MYSESAPGQKGSQRDVPKNRRVVFRLQICESGPVFVFIIIYSYFLESAGFIIQVRIVEFDFESASEVSDLEEPPPGARSFPISCRW